jgi:RNA polymerase sigma factor (sigma-70 family)
MSEEGPPRDTNSAPTGDSRAPRAPEPEARSASSAPDAASPGRTPQPEARSASSPPHAWGAHAGAPDRAPAATERSAALAALLARVALGDQRAFAQLYRQASAHLYAVAVRIVRNGSVAEEVLQEAFVSVWHHAATYNAAKSQPMTWLTSIVRNRCLDHLRKREVDTVALAPADNDDGTSAWDPPSGGPTAVELLEAGADARAIRNCIDALDAGPRQAIALAFFHGLSHGELAAQLREPLGTVKSWVRRGLERLRRCLDAAGVAG